MAWERVVSAGAGPTSGRARRGRFVECRRTGDRRIRDELVEAHVGLAEYLARRFLDRGEPFDDLRQVALVGLFKAVERFEPERGLQFSTFARPPTILGELKRHFPDRGWDVRVPRRVQELHLRIRATINEFSQEHGRSPTPEEIAGAIETPIDAVAEAIAADDLYRLQSLDAPTNADSQDSRTIDHAAGAREAEFARVEDRELLTTLLKGLPAREQRLIYLRFFEDRTQREIAGDLGISQMQVSRLLAHSFATLRQAASATPGDTMQNTQHATAGVE